MRKEANDGIASGVQVVVNLKLYLETLTDDDGCLFNGQVTE